MLKLLAALLMLWLPCDSQIKPAAIEGYEYDDLYWPSMGGQAALDLPLLGPGPKQDYSPADIATTFNGAPKFKADYVQLDGSSSFLSTSATFSNSPPVWYSAEIYVPSTSLACIVLDDAGGVASGGENNGMGVGIGQINGDIAGNNLLIPFWGVSWQDTGIALGTGWVSLDVVLTKASQAVAFVNGKLKFTGTSVMAATAATLGGFMIGADAETATRRYANIRVRRSHVLHLEPSAAQIAAFYNRPWSRFSLRQAVVGGSAAAFKAAWAVRASEILAGGLAA